MFKFLQVLFVMTVLVALCAAEAPRLRSARLQLQLQQRRRFLARQVLAEEEAAVTPYPAAGIKPEVPFDLPTEMEEQQDAEQQPEQQPDNTYLPPDNTYGPPPVAAEDDEVEEDINPAVADAEEDEAEVGSTPEQQPAVVNDADNEIDENADIIPSVNSESGRLVLASRRRSRKSAKLQRRQVRGRRLMRS